jgi:prepilin-type processing-associated H-X9-DG protein
MELNSLYDEIRWTDPPFNNANLGWSTRPENKAAVAARPPVMACPSDPGPAMADDAHFAGGSGYKASMDPSIPLAVGNYAFMMGTLGPVPASSSLTTAKYTNDGLFYYQKWHRLDDVTDGTNSTIAAGEGLAPSTMNSSNVWVLGWRFIDGLRCAQNPINTPPGTGYTYPVTGTQWGAIANGAFGSYHPGGSLFVFADGHVDFLSETMSLPIYQALATRAGNETNINY